jgi:WD40 repeat protein
VTAVLYLPDGTTLASTSLFGPILLRDVVRGTVIARFNLDGQWSCVKDLAVSPDGSTLVSGGNDAILRFFDRAQSHSTAPDL